MGSLLPKAIFKPGPMPKALRSFFLSLYFSSDIFFFYCKSCKKKKLVQRLKMYTFAVVYTGYVSYISHARAIMYMPRRYLYNRNAENKHIVPIYDALIFCFFLSIVIWKLLIFYTVLIIQTVFLSSPEIVKTIVYVMISIKVIDCLTFLYGIYYCYCL